ncbi:MAG: hypothetical protein ABW148_16405 [Sedimenticola sp.]
MSFFQKTVFSLLVAVTVLPYLAYLYLDYRPPTVNRQSIAAREPKKNQPVTLDLDKIQHSPKTSSTIKKSEPKPPKPRPEPKTKVEKRKSSPAKKQSAATASGNGKGLSIEGHYQQSSDVLQWLTLHRGGVYAVDTRNNGVNIVGQLGSNNTWRKDSSIPVSGELRATSIRPRDKAVQKATQVWVVWPTETWQRIESLSRKAAGSDSGHVKLTYAVKSGALHIEAQGRGGTHSLHIK